MKLRAIQYIAVAHIARTLTGIGHAMLHLLLAKVLTTSDYGRWNLFLIYSGCLTFTHLGFNDGAFLSWAKHPAAKQPRSVALGLCILIVQQTALTMLLIAVAFASGVTDIIVYLSGPSALFINVHNYLAFYFISRGQAVIEAALRSLIPFGPTVWVLLSHSSGRRLSLSSVVSCFIVFQLLALASSIAFLCQPASSPSPSGARARCRGDIYRNTVHEIATNISTGLPIMICNYGLLIAASLDRLLVSLWFRPDSVGVYCLGRQLVWTAATFLSSASPLLLPWFARAQGSGQKRLENFLILDRLLVFGATLAVPIYLLALRPLMGRFLPAYGTGLPVTDVLLVLVALNAAIQMVHSNISRLEGSQWRMFRTCVAFLCLEVVGISVVAWCSGSLTGVAVVVLAGWLAWYVADYVYVLKVRRDAAWTATLDAAVMSTATAFLVVGASDTLVGLLGLAFLNAGYVFLVGRSSLAVAPLGPRREVDSDGPPFFS